MTDVSLTSVIHGNSGVGKSWFADTAPGPRLILDVEGGTKWTPSRKLRWDPRTPIPAESADPDITTVVRVLDFETVGLIYQWLASGQHPWESVGIDSITELQARCLRRISGTNQPDQRDWGALLIEMSDVVTSFKDLTDHPTKPLQSVTFICGSIEKNGLIRANVQGQLQFRLPYYVDVLGYLYPVQNADQQLERCLLIQPVPPFDAKDRTDLLSAHHGPTITGPSIPALLEVLRAGRTAA